jgi:tRNA-uridine aminocarboxypropyltransferase
VTVAARDPGWPPAGGRCPRCLLVDCVCAEIPRIATRTRIVIVRHAAEIHRSSNTGRLAHLALPNSELVDHGRSGVVVDAAWSPGPGAWLLFPEGAPRTAPPAPPPERVVVLDATWRQARRMRQRLPGLRGVPILRLPDAPAPAARLRESPGPGLVSTLEAIARALRLLEGEPAAAALEHLFDLVVARSHAAGRSRRGHGR